MLWFTRKKSTEKNPLDLMRDGAYQTIVAPFNGREVPIKVRCLNEVQIRSCGNFGVLDFRSDKEKSQRLKDSELAEVVDTQEKLIQATLVSPTYEEIIDNVYGEDRWISSAKKELVELEKDIAVMSNSTEKTLLGVRINMLRMRIGYLLPGDFTAFVVSWALGIDRSDIRRLTKKMLIRAAAAAASGHDNPTDHLDGNFTPFHKTEINLVAKNLYEEFLEEQRVTQGAKKGGREYIHMGSPSVNGKGL